MEAINKQSGVWNYINSNTIFYVKIYLGFGTQSTIG